jgi:protein-S-isoprenylcysteine O-methyltransferase Ste14
MTMGARSVLTMFVGLIIFVFLPLAGWGLNSIESFFQNPARLIFIIFVLILNTYASIKIPEIGKEKTKGEKTVKRQHYAVMLLQVFSILLVLSSPYFDRRNILTIGSADLLRYAGLVLYAAGFLLMHWTEAYLGRQFSVEVTIQKDHELLTGGPFKYIRHPRYLGIIIFSIGIALIFISWIGLSLSLLILLVLLWRISDEEKLMMDGFGTKWEDYSNSTKKLIPFIY